MNNPLVLHNHNKHNNMLFLIIRALFLCVICSLGLIGNQAYAQSQTFDWSNLNIGSLQSVDSGTTLTAGPRTVTITHQEITNGGAFGPGFDDSILVSFAGQIGAQTGPLVYSMQNDSFDPNDRFQSVYSFNGQLRNLRFIVSHVDRDATPRNDGVTIEYDTGNGTFLNIRNLAGAVTRGPVVGLATLSGVQGYQGTASAGGLTSTTGDIAVNFGNTLVSRVRITYHFGQGETGAPQGGTQFIGLSDFTYDLPLPANFADLSLTKTVSNATPVNGASLNYVLTLNNSAASTATANNVIVTDLLPPGVTFNSVTGFGTYNSANGQWTISSIAPNQNRTITINVTVNSGSGRIVVNNAEVTFSPLTDSDSFPADGIGDDFASASFTVQGARTAGVAPALVCNSGTSTFIWGNQTLTAGTTNANFTAPNLGNLNMNIISDVALVAGSPAINNNNTGGNPAGTQSLFLNMNNTTRSQRSVTTFTLATAVPQLQMQLFDVDAQTGSFADQFTISGRFNGANVTPILTNGVSNFVSGNVVTGDDPSDSASPNGNVTITFQSPVDTVILAYGNGPAASADPTNQFANISNISYCNPQANLSVTKISNVISDPISGANPKAIPGAVIRYCITISNAGSATATSVSASDPLPANVTYTVGSLLSGATCAGATTVEDDDAIDPDESDPFGISFANNIVTGVANSLAPAQSFAIAFTATVN